MLSIAALIAYVAKKPPAVIEPAGFATPISQSETKSYFKLEPPFIQERDDKTIEIHRYIAISRSKLADLLEETAVFPSLEDGTLKSFDEIEVYTGELLSDEFVLADMGYKIAPLPITRRPDGHAL